jgi:hypothetical protein
MTAERMTQPKLPMTEGGGACNVGCGAHRCCLFAFREICFLYVVSPFLCLPFAYFTFRPSIETLFRAATCNASALFSPPHSL